MQFLSRRARSVLTLAAILAASGMSLQAAQADDSYYPGIPVLTLPADFPEKPGADVLNRGSWLNAPYNGRAGSVYSAQWARVSLGTLASNISFSSCDATSQGRTCPPRSTGEVVFGSDYYIQAFLVSPDGSPVPYGLGPVTTVRTVAFGSIPVEVEVQVQQARDSDGLPRPIIGETSDASVLNGDVQHVELDPGTLRGDVAVAVKGVRVDGVDVGLRGTCATSLTPLALESKFQRLEGDPLETFDPTESVYGFTGGGFAGDIDIPAFSRCGTDTGDDLSPLLTSALSGPGNPVNIQYGSTFCFADFNDDGTAKPTPPGSDTPEEAGCAQFQYTPQNPKLFAVPLPWEFPDVAPGDAP